MLIYSSETQKQIFWRIFTHYKDSNGRDTSFMNWTHSFIHSWLDRRLSASSCLLWLQKIQHTCLYRLLLRCFFVILELILWSMKHGLFEILKKEKERPHRLGTTQKANKCPFFEWTINLRRHLCSCTSLWYSIYRPNILSSHRSDVFLALCNVTGLHDFDLNRNWQKRTVSRRVGT